MVLGYFEKEFLPDELKGAQMGVVLLGANKRVVGEFEVGELF